MEAKNFEVVGINIAGIRFVASSDNAITIADYGTRYLEVSVHATSANFSAALELGRNFTQDNDKITFVVEKAIVRGVSM